jgi:hypothetical protein
MHVHAHYKRPSSCYMSMMHVHVSAACPWFMFVLQVHAVFPCCFHITHVHFALHFLHVHSACQCCMSMLHIRAPCPCLHAACPYCIPVLMPKSSCCMSMPHVHVACPCCMNMLHEDENEHIKKMNTKMKMNIKRYDTARPCCLSVLHVHSACHFCMSVLHVHAPCPCSRCMSMSMLLVHHAGHFACPFCMPMTMSILHVHVFMLNVHPAYPYCMSKQCVMTSRPCIIKRQVMTCRYIIQWQDTTNCYIMQR